ncbi:alpha/beta fold hydrolase [Streptomyces sp. NPDC058864]
MTLLHGFPSSSYDWAAVVPHLAARGHRVTTVDFLGLGKNNKPDPHAYSVLEQADLVEALWALDGLTATALVAHDYGVSVAQELLARGPHRITSVTWLNGGIFPDLHHPTPEQQALHGPQGPDLARHLDETKFTASVTRLTVRALPDAVLHDMWDGTRTRDGLRVLPALLRYMDERKLHAARWTEVLRACEDVQQFVWGPADPVSGAHVIPRIAEFVPRSRLTVLDDPPAVGHFPQVEAPELVVPLLAEWLGSAPG